ncbi:MAG: hypothetical protein IJE10_03460 [Clostridia bacterium]|nr:hypothetical protein [Clostridia bacterium]
MRKIKRFVTVLVALLALLCPVATYAAPQTLSAGAGSNSYNLIVITNPPSFSSTSQGGVVFCGYGSKNTTVTLYRFNNATQRYEKMGVSASTINDSGVFWKKVNLPGGLNKILIYAENGGYHQVVRREVTVTSSSFTQKMKDYTVNMSTALQMGR